MIGHDNCNNHMDILTFGDETSLLVGLLENDIFISFLGSRGPEKVKKKVGFRESKFTHFQTKAKLFRFFSIELLQCFNNDISTKLTAGRPKKRVIWESRIFTIEM